MSTTTYTRPNDRTITLAAVTVAALTALAGADVAMDFEWRNGERRIVLDIDPGLDAAVAMGGIAVDDLINAAFRPRANAARYTIGDSFRLALDTWNHANSNAYTPGGASNNPWRFFLPGQLGAVVEAMVPRVTVRAGVPVLAADDAGPAEGIPRFRRPPSSGSGGSRGSNDDDARRGNGGGGGVTEALMLFVLKDRFTPTQWSTAEIYVNPLVDWGTQAGAFFDPIIVALHELGHAIRLDHTVVGLNNTIGPFTIYPNGDMATPNGPVMRPFTDQGNNMTNPLAGTIYERFPDFIDIDDASRSASLAPTPGTLVIGAMGLALIGRRRRA